jgi:hypothetical protein
MSKTLNELVYSVRGPLKGWISSQNEVISDEFLYREIADARSFLLKKWFKENKWIDFQSYAQTCCLEICCHHIQCRDKFTGQMIDSGEVQYKVTAPYIESSLGEQAIIYFGDVDMKHPYAKRSVLGGVFSRFNFYTHSVPSFSRVDNIYTIENLPDTGTKFVTLVAILEDVLPYCNPDDIFPFPNHLIYELEQLVSQRLTDPARKRPASKATTTDNNPVNVQTVAQKAEV